MSSKRTKVTKVETLNVPEGPGTRVGNASFTSSVRGSTT